MIRKIKTSNDRQINDSFAYASGFKEKSTEGKHFEYRWTRDPDDLRSYTRLIDKYYESELRLPDSYKKIDYNDLNSYFLVGYEEDKLFGGTKISLNNPLVRNSLPNEKLGFNYSLVFPELNLRERRYCEISRTAINEKHRGNSLFYTISFDLFKKLMDKNDIRYMFICASKARLRLYKSFASKTFTYLDTREYDVKEWSEDSNLEFYIAAFENN